MSVLYPVAANAESALSRPVGRAARESEAAAVATSEVEFVTEAVGPGYASADAALEAWSGRVDEGRPGKAVAPEDRYCTLREVVAEGAPRRALAKPARPAFKDGRRWPAPKAPPATVWRLSVSYWRVVDAARLSELKQARKARKSAGAEAMDAATLRALARQPLLPVRPQQPLDVGLFEVRLPENPNLLMPDE